MMNSASAIAVDAVARFRTELARILRDGTVEEARAEALDAIVLLRGRGIYMSLPDHEQELWRAARHFLIHGEVAR